VQEENKYFCKEHLDKAFDDYLLENERFPNVVEDTEHKCNYCQKQSEYKLCRDE